MDINERSKIDEHQNIHILRKIILFSIMFVMFCSTLLSQDIHYSQFYNAPLNLNPALAGVFRGDIRFQANYRNQWRSVPVDYLTFSLAADMKFIRRSYKKGFFSGGVVFHYDQAGYSKLNLSSLGLSGSYTRQLGKKIFGSIGLNINGNQRAFKLEDLTFDSQYDPATGNFNPNLSINEDLLSTSRFFMDIGGGLNFHWQAHSDGELVDRLDKRTKFDIGAGLFHINTPNQSLYEGDVAQLSFRYSPYIMATIQLSKSVDLVVDYSSQFQDPYQEWLVHLGGKVWLNRKLGKQIALQLSSGYRFHRIGDGFSAIFEVYYNGWHGGFSYDINISDFDIATKGRGGPEVSVRYVIRKVRAIPEFKICPLI